MNGKRENGYSLVEVCLALLVAGLGVIVVFGLFPEGLGQSRRSVEATEIGAFADYVFSALTVRACTNDPLAWTDFGQGRLNEAKGLIEEEAVVIPANYTNFYWKPQIYGKDYAGSGRQSSYIEQYRIASFTYSLQSQDIPPIPPNMKGVRLEVWPGDRTNLPGRVFYREFTPIR
jgi:hypothetical protein